MREFKPLACRIQCFLRVPAPKDRPSNFDFLLFTETVNQLLELWKDWYRVSHISLFPTERNPTARRVDVFSQLVCTFGRSNSRPAHEFYEISRVLCVSIEFLRSDGIHDCKKLVPSWCLSNRLVHSHLLELHSRRLADRFM